MIELTALALLFYIAVWAIATGVLEIVAAIRLRKEIENEWMLIIAGLASVVFGTLLMAQPAAGALAAGGAATGVRGGAAGLGVGVGPR